MYQDIEPGIIYMKFLHLQTKDELFEINFEFKWKEATKASSANNFRHASQILIFK